MQNEFHHTVGCLRTNIFGPKHDLNMKKYNRQRDIVSTFPQLVNVRACVYLCLYVCICVCVCVYTRDDHPVICRLPLTVIILSSPPPMAAAFVKDVLPIFKRLNNTLRNRLRVHYTRDIIIMLKRARAHTHSKNGNVNYFEKIRTHE